MRADGGHELVVHRHRDVVVEQRGADGGGMMAHPGGVDIPLHRAGEGGGERVGMGGVLVVELVEGGPAHAPIGIEEKRREGGVGELRRSPPAVHDRAELHVGVGELPKDLGGGPGERPLHGEQFFLPFRKDVRTGANEPLEADGVRRQDRQVEPGGERRRIDAEDLGPEKARLLRQRRGDMLETPHHPLRLRSGLILAGPQMRVGAEPVSHPVDLDVIGEAAGEILRRTAERAGEGDESGDHPLPGRQSLFPRPVGGEQAGEIPGIPHRYLSAGLEGAVGIAAVHSGGILSGETGGRDHGPDAEPGAGGAAVTAATRRSPRRGHRRTRTRQSCSRARRAPRARLHRSPAESTRSRCCRSGRC